MKSFFNFTIKKQIYVNSFLLIVIPLLILAIFNYQILNSGTTKQIEDRLTEQALQIKMLVSTTYNEIKSMEREIDIQAKNIVKVQAEAISKFTDKFPGTDEELKEIISNIKVGKTGYIWVTDYEGNYIISLGRKRDGESIFNAKDSNGVYFIQEAIKKTKKLTSNNVDYQIYPWKNKGEKIARNKINHFIINSSWVQDMLYRPATKTKPAGRMYNAVETHFNRMVSSENTPKQSLFEI